MYGTRDKETIQETECVVMEEGLERGRIGPIDDGWEGLSEVPTTTSLQGHINK